MAEAHTTVLGGCASRARDSQRVLVPSTRLERILAFFSAVHLPAAMFSPARCTTASSPSRPAVSTLPAAGSHCTSAVPGRGRDRTRRVTRCPLLVRKGTRAEPTSPLAQVTRTFTGHPPLQGPCSAIRILSMARQFFEQRPSLLQVRRIKPLGEPAVNLRQHLLSFCFLALLLPQPAQAHHRPQLQRLRPLPPGNLAGPLKTRCGFRLRLGAGCWVLSVGNFGLWSLDFGL